MVYLQHVMSLTVSEICSGVPATCHVTSRHSEICRGVPAMSHHFMLSHVRFAKVYLPRHVRSHVASRNNEICIGDVTSRVMYHREICIGIPATLSPRGPRRCKLLRLPDSEVAEVASLPSDSAAEN